MTMPLDETEIAAHLAANDTEHASFKRRLDEHQRILDEHGKIYVALERQSAAIESMNKSVGRVETKVDGLAGRVEKIEQEPAQNWKRITWEIVKYVVLALVGLAVGLIIKGGA